MLSRLMLSAPLLFALPAAPQALTSGPPPIKMGLWESTMNNGMTAPLKAHICVTPDSYQSAFARMPAGCTISNQTRTHTHASGDIACASTRSSGHFDVDFPDPESGHSTVEINLNIQGKPMAMTIKTDSKFIGSDCGAVVPGKPEILR